MSDSLQPMDCSLPGSSGNPLWDFPGKNTEGDCFFRLQGIFLMQGWRPRLLHWHIDCLLLSYHIYISFRYTTWWFNICIRCEVIIIISLVNIHHHTYLKFLFLSWELLICTFLATFKCTTVLLTLITILYIISPWLIL